MHDHRWRGPVTSAALVTLLCLIVAVVTWFSITLYHQNDSRPTASAPHSSAAPAPKPAPPPPPPVTVTAAPAPQPTTNPSTAQPAPSTVVPEPTTQVSATDQKFLDLMGRRVPTADAAQYAIQKAHAVCSYIASHPDAVFGSTTLDNWITSTTIYVGSYAVQFAYNSVVSYCPRYAPENF
jgi:hypothetical protein